MKNTLLTTLDGIRQIREFAENNPDKARELELFSFTEDPARIQDLVVDLKTAIKLLDVTFAEIKEA